MQGSGLPGQGYCRTCSLLFLSLVREELTFLASQRAKPFPGLQKVPFRSPLWRLPLPPSLSSGGWALGLRPSCGTHGFWSELGIPSYSDDSFLGLW